jgi:hypothetical protein
MDKTPRLHPTLVLNHTPQQLADKLGGLMIGGGIIMGQRNRVADNRYSKAHEALQHACVTVAMLIRDHKGAEEVSALLDKAFDLFEDTVTDAAQEPTPFVDVARELDDKERARGAA